MLQKQIKLAAASGLEPEIAESKSTVLPLTPHGNLLVERAGFEPAQPKPLGYSQLSSPILKSLQIFSPFDRI